MLLSKDTKLDLMDYSDDLEDLYQFMEYQNYTFGNDSLYDTSWLENYLLETDINTQEDIYGRISYIVTPILVTIGVVGNMMSALILCSSKLQHESVSVFLTACLISDSLFLTGLLCLWLSGHYFSPHYAQWCQFLSMINNSSTFLSMWFNICLALHQWIFLISGKKCTTMNAQILVLGVTSVAVVVFVNMTLTIDAQTIGSSVMCLPFPHMLEAVQILYKLDLLINTLFPYCIFLSVSIHTCYCYIRSSIEKRRQGEGHRSVRRMENGHRRRNVVNNHPTISSSSYSTTTCILPLILFLQLPPLPHHVLRMIHTARELLNIRYYVTDFEHVMHNVMQYPLYITYACKGYLLFCVWKQYRQHTVKILKRVCKYCLYKLYCKRRREEEYVTTMWQQSTRVNILPMSTAHLMQDMTML